MTRWGLSLLALATSGVVIASFATAGPGNAPRYSNQGRLLPLSAPVRAAMIRAHRSPHIYRLATLRRLTIFRFGDSGLCYGATHDFRLGDVTVASVPGVFGGYGCWKALSPVMDFSIVGASRKQPTMHIERLTGIAADNIRAIEVLSETGHVLGSAPVKHNVYAMWSPPGDAVSLRAVTTTGKRLRAIP